jgi:NADH-quinone oxidoreductase subunit C
MSAGQPPVGAAISLRQTTPTSRWLGAVCPRCGNQIAVGHEVVLCPKCYTPHHASCWRENNNQCANDGTPARIIERPGRPAAEAPAAAVPAAPAPARAAAPAPAAPAAPAAAQAARPAPPPPRPVPGAAARPAARGAAGPSVREAPGLQPMAVVRQRLEAALSDLNPQFGVSVDEVSVTVPAAQIQEAARRCKEREELQFDYLRCLSAVDYQAEGIEVVYHLFSTRQLQKCVLKTRVPGEGHSLPTVTTVWAGANWHEREAAEMFNIRFDGHPKLEPLLLEKDEQGRIVPGPILLKRFPLRPKEPPGVYGFPIEEEE